MGQFQDDIDTIRKTDRPVKIDENTFWDMLGSTPPIFNANSSFVNGEVYKHNTQGVAMYYCFYIDQCNKKNQAYYGVLSTLDSFKKSRGVIYGTTANSVQ